jgi:hypothetical protein
MLDVHDYLLFFGRAILDVRFLCGKALIPIIWECSLLSVLIDARLSSSLLRVIPSGYPCEPLFMMELVRRGCILSLEGVSPSPV